jgi:hypothetical protein
MNQTTKKEEDITPPTINALTPEERKGMLLAMYWRNERENELIRKELNKLRNVQAHEQHSL